MIIDNYEELVVQYNLKVNRDNNLVSLTYHQINTPNCPETNMYRGLVVDTNTNKVVCYPFYRFNDYNSKKDIIAYDNGVFYEKIDGSLCTLYYYNNKWNISTKGTPTGKGLVHKDNEITFSDYYFQYLIDTSELNKDYYYITEFKFPSDKHHFIPCISPSITLIGVRDSNTMKELPISLFRDLSCFNHLTPISFNNDKELYDVIYNLNPYTNEGYVYVSNELNDLGNYTRYKIKSPQFDTITNLSVMYPDKQENKKWLAEICLVNKHRDFLIEYPMFVDVVKGIDEKIEAIRKEISDNIHLTNQELRVATISQIAKTYLFLKLKQQQDLDTYIRNLNVYKII